MTNIPREWFKMAAKWKRLHTNRESVINTLIKMQGATAEQAEYVTKYIFSKATQATQPAQCPTIYYIPEGLFKQSIGNYDRNQFAKLLRHQFGEIEAHKLLKRFEIGTSNRWPGACIFWLKDECGRARSGQVVLFADDWHKAHYTDRVGNKKVCISSVSYSMIHYYRQKDKPLPEWLDDYHNNAPRWPVLFGLQQLATAPLDQPVAIVEAPKTAVVCSAFMPDFIWLAAGALSYLNAERLLPLRGRVVMLFPDLSKDRKAFNQWSRVANDLNKKGYHIEVSELLERLSNDEQKAAGLDLADFLLSSNTTRPRWVLDGKTIYGEVLIVEPCDSYPSDWDAPSLPST